MTKTIIITIIQTLIRLFCPCKSCRKEVENEASQDVSS